MGTMIHAMVDQFCVAIDESVCSLNRKFATIPATARLLVIMELISAEVPGFVMFTELLSDGDDPLVMPGPHLDKVTDGEIWEFRRIPENRWDRSVENNKLTPAFRRSIFDLSGDDWQRCGAAYNSAMRPISDGLWTIVGWADNGRMQMEITKLGVKKLKVARGTWQDSPIGGHLDDLRIVVS